MTISSADRAMYIGMLRQGKDGNQITEILNVIATGFNSREQVCEDLGIADCPENDDEISAHLAGEY